jgi:transcriptional regulator with XRE-family HTH domain
MLNRLGRNIRTARLRRRLSMEKLAERIGISRYVMADVEKGKPTTAIAAYVGALWALGLHNDIRDLADPDRDEEGKILERARSPRTAPKRKIIADDF